MQGTLFARRSAAITWSLIGVDYAYFDKLRMIVPIANVFEAGKPLFFAASIARSRLRAERMIIAR